MKYNKLQHSKQREMDLELDLHIQKCIQSMSTNSFFTIITDGDLGDFDTISQIKICIKDMCLLTILRKNTHYMFNIEYYEYDYNPNEPSIHNWFVSDLNWYHHVVDEIFNNKEYVKYYNSTGLISLYDYLK